MPPSKSARSASMKQAKLSFASKRTVSSAAAGKGTKASTRKQPTRSVSSPEAAIVLSDSSDDELEVPAPKKRRLTPLEDIEDDEKTEREREPLDPSDKRWRKAYGDARREMGDIEPVHAKGQKMVDHILRVFDLSYQYGPCVGISRLQRWERAEALGLNPPPEVKAILMTKEGDTDERYTQSVFQGEI
ncbi:DNA polymerase delta, subunit 4-domain-containing protein [Earliella scabrosa]|nr:DNA polymerase delta, subunit 4-domain-containing protein [Earliella scabrosa]